MQTERGVVTQYAEGVNTREPVSSPCLAQAKGDERAELYHCAPVPPECSSTRHDYTGRDTCAAGFPAGGVKVSSPESGQVNVQSNNYWSSTEYAPNPNNAWNFNFNNGNQNNNNKNNNNYGWAVQSGE